MAKARRNKSSDNLNQNEVKQKDIRPRQRSNDSSARPVIKLNLKDLRKDAEKDLENESISPTSKSPRKSPKTRTGSVTSSTSLSKDSPKSKSIIRPWHVVFCA